MWAVVAFDRPGAGKAVAAFLSPEWATDFDAALGGVTLPEPGDDAGLVASTGRFAVVQEVHGLPGGGTATLRLTVDGGAMHLSLGNVPETAGAGDGDGAPERAGADGAPETAGDGEVTGTRPDVTLSLSYDDAVALSKGELVAADALTAGRIKVRGDLSVLVASQRMLAAAQPHLATVTAETTY